MADSHREKEVRTTGQRVISQANIEESILEDNDLLEEATDEYSAILEAEARAEVAYKKKRHSCFLKANGSVRDKEAFSEKEAEDEYETYLLEAAKAKAQLHRLKMLHARLEGLRSINANLRSQVS